YGLSASVYGAKDDFIEERQFEAPLNIYGYSKFLFDQLVRRHFASGLAAPVVGLRYFNVYGPREAHKGRMSSVVLHNFRQYWAGGRVKLFAGCQGYANGAQLRDFISVEDVVKVNLFFLDNHLNDNEEVSGIFNCGTGIARSFNDLALATINACRRHQDKAKLTLEEAISEGVIEYIPFPEELAGRYQCYTQANLEQLRDAGFNLAFLNLELGVERYIDNLVK
ncbi:MAG: NAD-dependent epimerase/dehydratase family protein, partial [Burkholderiales bacterium]